MLRTQLQIFLVSLLFFIAIPTLAYSGGEISSLSASEAYEKGKILHWQGKEESANKYLKYSADLGNANAAYMYSMMLAKPSLVQGEDEYSYALKAAKKNHLLAMLKVSDDSSLAGTGNPWFSVTERTLLERSKHGDSDAMRYLYSLYSDLDTGLPWLKKASDAGNPKAQYMLAELYEEDITGWFFLPGSRTKEVSRLYKESADSAYPPAISAYANILVKSGNKKMALTWYEKEVKLGVADVLTYLASIYSGQNKNWADVVPIDKVKAASYYSAYFDNMNKTEDNQNLYEYDFENYQQLLSSMSSEEKQQASQLAKDFLSNHTVRAFDDFWEWGVDYGERPD